MFEKKIKELEDKRKKIKKEKLEKKKRAERRKKREEKRKLEEKKALEKRKKLQARRQAIEDEKLAKQREIERAEELVRREKEKKQKIEEKQKKKEKKETEKFLKERQKKHQEYLKLKEKMEKEKKNLLEKDESQNLKTTEEKKKVETDNTKSTKGKRVKKKKGFKRSTFAGIMFLLICIACLAYSSYQIFIWVKSSKDLVTIEEEVISKVVTEINDTSKDYSIDINFGELLDINQDVVGWIYIKDTDINYPIMQAKDNDYYLKKNIYREYSSCGSIFLDCNTDGFNEDNTVVYGHNLKNQKMFADLKKIYDGEFGKDVYIEVYDKDNNFIKYKIFATYMVEPTLEVVKKDFKISEKKKYIDNAYNQSTVKFNCGFNYQKDLLTLVTCDNTGNKRIIVNALRVN